MEICKLQQNEVSAFKNLLEIFQHVFEIEAPISDVSHLGCILANPDFLVFVVKHNDKVVGGLTLYVLQSYYGKKPVAYIYDVGISPEFQRKGFGKALIKAVCTYCKDNGFEEAFVEAEADDSNAVNFYRSTNSNVEMQAIHFTYAFH
jgi:aminoglycoside 3-N-acetyltransferase I